VNNGKIVWWAIQRMNDDYSLRDIRPLLMREGRNMKSSEISVVLTRLKSRGEVKELKCSRGPMPAVYRKPERATPPETKSDDLIGDAETTTASAAAA